MFNFREVGNGCVQSTVIRKWWQRRIFENVVLYVHVDQGNSLQFEDDVPYSKYKAKQRRADIT